MPTDLPSTRTLAEPSAGPLGAIHATCDPVKVYERTEPAHVEVRVRPPRLPARVRVDQRPENVVPGAASEASRRWKAPAARQSLVFAALSVARTWYWTDRTSGSTWVIERVVGVGSVTSSHGPPSTRRHSS